MEKEVDIQFISKDGHNWADPSFPIYCGNTKCNHYQASNKYELGKCTTSPELTINSERVTFCNSAST